MNQEITLSPLVMGLGTSVPRLSLTQSEILDFILKNFKIKESTQSLYKRTLQNKSIHTRHFALEKLSDVLDQDHDRINARFEKEAVQLSAQALTNALQSAGLGPQQVDYLAATTCTGYICPGLAAHLIGKLKMRADTHYADLVGMGCAAAIPALEQASHFLKANPGAIAAVVSTEICSAAMFSNDDIDIVISNSIFSDGSAAAILKDPLPSFASWVVPEWKDTLRFKTERGFLKNVLGKEVPQQAAAAVKKLVANILEGNELLPADIQHWMIHPGGEKILQEIEKSLGLTKNQTQASWNVLREHGNMSSASILFVLNKEMEIYPPRPGERGILCSFGAGFSAHAALVEF